MVALREPISGMAAMALPAPGVWAEAARRETGRDPLRDAAPAAPAGPVAFLARDTASAAAIVFTCIAAGRPSLALDADGPEARNLALLRAAGAAILAVGVGQAATVESAAELADQHGARLAAGLVTGGATVRLLASDASGDAMPPDSDALGIDAPAFIFPTSGSTGQPKLIVHSQRTASYLAGLYSAAVLSDDRLLCVSGAPGSYSATLYLLTTAQRGASLHLADLRRDGVRRFLDRMAAERMTVLRGGVSLFHVLAGLPGTREAMVGLRSVHLAGEPAGRADIGVLRPLLPAGCQVVSTYAATECMSFSCQAREDDDRDVTRVPAGFIELGGEAAVLDEAGRLCPPGEAGELVVRSRYNALGEWLDGRLVVGRLIPDPALPGTRVYFTGDLARASAGGAIVVLGRKDRMMKINGQRVEPMEVEAAIRALADVVDVTVLPRKVGDAVLLVAFVVPGERGRMTIGDALRDRLRRHLPVHMVPSRIVVLDALPRLANGKVDGMALLAGLG